MPKVYLQNNVLAVEDDNRNVNYYADPSGSNFYMQSSESTESIYIKFTDGTTSQELVNINQYDALDEGNSIQDIANSTLPDYNQAIAYLTTILGKEISTNGGGGGGNIRATTEIDYKQLDLAGEQPVSEKTTLVDVKRVGKESHLINNVIGGSATNIHLVADSATELAVTNNGDYVIQQTYQRFPYFSGKPLTLQATYYDFEPVLGVEKFIGYMDSDTTAPYNTGLDGVQILSKEDAVYLQIWKDGTLLYDIIQDDWNQDNLTGRGDANNPSEEFLDFSKFQVQNLDILWLGGGGVKLSYRIGDRIIVAHIEKSPNVIPSTYFRQPNKPLRWGIRSTGGAGNFKAVCGTLVSRGSINSFSFSKDLRAEIESASGNQWKPILALRLQDGLENVIPILRKYSTYCSSNANFQTTVFLCRANSNPVTPYLEVNGTPTDWGTILFTTGDVLDYKNDFDNTYELIVSDEDGFGGSFGTTSADLASNNIARNQYIGQSIDGDKDVLVIAIRKFGGGTEDYNVIADFEFFL